MPFSQKSEGVELSSDSYQELFDLVPYPLVILRPDSPRFTIIDSNNKYLEATQTRREKIIGKSLFDLYRDKPKDPPGCDMNEIIEHLDELIRTRAPELSRVFRWDVRTPDDNKTIVKYWNMTITPVLSASGKVVQILSAPTDVTRMVELERNVKQARKEVEFQKQYLHDIFLQAPMGVGIYIGPDFVVDLINPALGNFLGYDYRELLGKPFFEVVDEAAGMGWEKILHKVLYTNEPFVGLEHPVKLRRNGKIEQRYCTFIVYPFNETAGKTSGLIKVSVDVTEQVLLKQALQENEERLKIAVDSAKLSVWDLDLKTNQVLTREAIDIPGFPDSGEVWTVDRYLQVLLPEDRQLGMDAIAEALKTGQFNVQLRTRGEDSSQHWVQGTGKVFTDDKNNPTHIIGTTQDITTRMELDRHKNELITTVSHELKTPVTSLKAIGQMLENKFLKSEDKATHTMLQKMNAQITRITALIHDLLDVSRIEGGKMQLRESHFLLYDLIEDVVSEVQRTTVSHEILIEKEKLIPCFSDRERLGQVITNLLTNAIKYSPGKSKVLISATFNEREITCCVTDFGIGIPKEKIAHIFDRFFRVIEERNYAFQGIGLGLYISSEIIKRLGGRIWVTSEPGEGSKFCFSIPADRD